MESQSEFEEGNVMKIVIINFSGRENGNCHAISQTISNLHLSEDVCIFNFSTLFVNPCGKCNYDCFEDRENCPYKEDSIYKLYESITSSNLAYFIVPNYCNYPNANYFIFNERSQCYFQRHQELLHKYLAVEKKFIVVSNTEAENFAHAFQYQILEDKTPNILFLAAKKYQRISIAGDLMSSPQADADLRKFCCGGLSLY